MIAMLVPYSKWRRSFRFCILLVERRLDKESFQRFKKIEDSFPKRQQKIPSVLTGSSPIIPRKRTYAHPITLYMTCSRESLKLNKRQARVQCCIDHVGFPQCRKFSVEFMTISVKHSSTTHKHSLVYRLPQNCNGYLDKISVIIGLHRFKFILTQRNHAMFLLTTAVLNHQALSFFVLSGKQVQQLIS